MKTWATLLTGLLLAGFSGSAGATPIQFVDVHDPADVYINTVAGGGVTSYSFQHSILTHGYNAATDTLLSATIDLNFRDSPSDPQAESVRITLDTTSVGATFVLGNSNFTLGFGTPTDFALSALADGLLDVVITRQNGDVYFTDSTLTANADRVTGSGGAGNGSTIPEPASLALFGLGLIGIYYFRRRRTPVRA